MGVAQPDVHVKLYSDRTAKLRAEGNYLWLARLGSPLKLPTLLSSGERYLSFEHVTGRHARPADLVMLASNLGAVHASASSLELHDATLIRPWLTTAGHWIPDFQDRRLAAVARELGSKRVRSPALGLSDVTQLFRSASEAPAAFYKDANPRNFLITAAGPVTIDFDDLSLAPFGYDLAKLVVTLSMTYGALEPDHIAKAVTAYNIAVSQLPGVEMLTWAKLLDWAEVHHILTCRFIGSSGYRHSWNDLRPSSVTRGTQ